MYIYVVKMSLKVETLFVNSGEQYPPQQHSSKTRLGPFK